MERFEHGGDVYANRGAVDFSASLNPLGMPDGVRVALREGVDSFDSYPDVECRELVAAISEREGVPASQVLACAGATDALARVCLALRPKRALVCAPSYSGYEQSVEQAGGETVRHFLRESRGFAPDESLVRDLDGVDAVFLANPNNPTGLTVDAELLERIIGEAGVCGVKVVLDESFIDFTSEPGAARLLGRAANLVIVKSLTKTYAMAGVRVGYLLCADEGFMRACSKAGQPWAVSTPAQVAGVAALADSGFIARTRDYVDARRRELEQGLSVLGLRVLPGKANYLMFESPRPLYAPLLDRGFIVRRCENFVGLDGRWYRVAVRTEAENAALVAAMKEVLS